LQIAKRVFGDPRHAWQTNKNKAQKQNKNKNKMKKTKHEKKKDQEKKRNIGIRYSRNYLVKLFHDECSIIILICSR